MGSGRVEVGPAEDLMAGFGRESGAQRVLSLAPCHACFELVVFAVCTLAICACSRIARNGESRLLASSQ